MSHSGPTASSDDSLALAVLNAVPDVLLWCRYDDEKAENIVEWCNDVAVHATGLSRDEIIGMTARRLMPGPSLFDDPATRRAVFDRVRQLGVYEYPAGVSFANGLRPLRVRATWVRPNENYILIQVEMLRDRE